jgi:hypothetical protein
MSDSEKDLGAQGPLSSSTPLSTSFAGCEYLLVFIASIRLLKISTKLLNFPFAENESDETNEPLNNDDVKDQMIEGQKTTSETDEDNLPSLDILEGLNEYESNLFSNSS